MTKTHTIDLKRHFKKLSAQEVDELVDAVADLVVAFVKRGGKPRITTGSNPSQHPTKAGKAERS